MGESTLSHQNRILTRKSKIRNPKPMFCRIARPLLNSPPPTTTTTFAPLTTVLRRINHRSLTTMSSSPSETIIEHIVLFKVNQSTDQSKLDSMVNSLNEVKSLDMVLHLTAGAIHRNRSSSTSLNFTHLLHSRYRTKDDLAQYSTHPAHLNVVKTNVLPICDAIMAVDWVASGLDGSVVPNPGSAMRVQLLKLKDGLGVSEKREVLGVISGLKEKVINGFDQLSFGENFSPARAKGFSIVSIGLFSGMNELDSFEENVEIAKEKEKVRDFIDDLVIVDYVVPSA